MAINCFLFTLFPQLHLLLMDCRHVLEALLIWGFSVPLPDHGSVVFDALAVLTSQLEHLVFHLPHVLQDLVLVHARSEANDLR